MNKTVLLASAALGVMLTAAPAMAEQATSPQASANSGFSDDAIVVTARRRAEDVSKVPVAVTAFSGAALEAKGVTNTFEITKLTPGLSISAGGTKANPFVVLRGQSKAVTGNGSPGVIIYSNEVPLPGYGSLIQTYDMDNIQVLKGPQGTLFGRNSIGGAILTYTKAPTHEFGGYVKGELGQYSHQMAEGAINLPIVKDRIALRVAAQVGYDASPYSGAVYTPYSLAANPTPSQFVTVATFPTSTTPSVVKGTGALDAFIATPGVLKPGAHLPGDQKTESYRVSLLVEPVDGIKNVTVFDYSRIQGAPAQFLNNMYTNGLKNDGKNIALFYQSPAFITSALAGSFGVGSAAFAGIVSQLAQCGGVSGTNIGCNVFAAQAALQGKAIPGGITMTTQDPWLSVTKVMGLSNTTTIQLGDNHQFKNIVGLRTNDSYSNTNLTGLPLPVILTSSYTKQRVLSEEAQLSGSFFDDDLKYTAGVFLFNERPQGNGGTTQQLETSALFGLSRSLSSSWTHNNSKAVYGQFDYSLDKIIPGLTVTAGLRQTWDEQSACGTTQTISPFNIGPAMLTTSPANLGNYYATEAQCQSKTSLPAGAVASTIGTTKFKKLTYTFGANWQITPDAMVYVTHRRGYRSGALNTPVFDPYLASVQAYQPETLTDWEVGLKAKWEMGGMRGTVEIAAYTGDDQGNQLPVSTSNLAAATGCVAGAQNVTTGVASPILCRTDGVTVDANNAANGRVVRVSNSTTTINAGRLTMRGIEAAGTISPIQGLTFGGSVSYFDTKVKSLTFDPNLQAFMAANGRTFPTTIAIQGQPIWTSNFNVTAELPTKVLGGTLIGTVDYRYSGAFTSVDIKTPSSTQWNARVSLEDIDNTGLTAAVWVRNITNEVVYEGTGSSSPSGIGADSYVLGMPRTVGGSLTYKF